MQNKTLVLAFFVLVGVVLGGMVWATHMPAGKMGGKNAVRKLSTIPALPEVPGPPVKAVVERVEVRKAPVVPQAQPHPLARTESGGVTGPDIASAAPENGGVKGVPVSGKLNASGMDPRHQRKEPIMVPEDGGGAGTEGVK